MNILIRTFLVYCLMITGTRLSSAQNSSKKMLLELRAQIDSAVNINSRSQIAQSAYALERLTQHTDIKKYARYYAAYAFYKMYTLPAAEEKKPDNKFLDSAQDHLERAIKIDPGFAEGHALLSSIYGMKAAGFLSGMKYGPKAQSSGEKAFELASDNPRVYLIDGIGDFYKPKMFGGGVDNALESLNKAVELFPGFQPENELSPDWGHAEAYAWLGQVYSKLKQFDKAGEAYRQALEVDPDFNWVKYELLPELTNNKPANE